MAMGSLRRECQHFIDDPTAGNRSHWEWNEGEPVTVDSAMHALLRL